MSKPKQFEYIDQLTDEIKIGFRQNGVVIIEDEVYPDIFGEHQWNRNKIENGMRVQTLLEQEGHARKKSINRQRRRNRNRQKITRQKNGKRNYPWYLSWLNWTVHGPRGFSSWRAFFKQDKTSLLAPIFVFIIDSFQFIKRKIKEYNSKK